MELHRPILLFLSLLIAPTLSLDFKFPHEYGFYPHPTSCDRYYKCENSKSELKTCGNGLAFDTSDPKFLAENCDYLHNVDCGDRTELEPAQSTKNCPRLYGIFADEEKCEVFYSCWNGEASRYTCSPGLAYDTDAKVCLWADQVPGCKISNQKEGGFSCPDAKLNPNAHHTFSRHAHPEDCRKYYVCLDGNAREYGCPVGTVFKIGSDEYSGQCEDPEGVDGCENYYGDELKNFKKSQLLSGLDYTQVKSSNKKKQHKVQQQQQPQVQRQEQQRVKVVRPVSTTAATTTTTTTKKPVVASTAKNDEYYYYEDQ